MTRALIDADGQLLEQAQVLLGTATKQDTINCRARQVLLSTRAANSSMTLGAEHWQTPLTAR